MAVIKGNLFVYNALIDRNDIDVNSQDIDGNSIAHYAVHSSNDELRNKIFSDPKIDINIQNKKFNTPLHDAIISEKNSAAISLIKNERIIIKIKKQKWIYSIQISRIKSSMENY